MDARIKALWTAALRSGEYPQTKGRLHNEEGFCCFGVLCDLFAKEVGGKWLEHGTFESSKCSLPAAGLPPMEVYRWAGFKEGTRFKIVGHAYVGLAEHNDGGRTFEEIAKAIEEQA